MLCSIMLIILVAAPLSVLLHQITVLHLLLEHGARIAVLLNLNEVQLTLQFPDVVGVARICTWQCDLTPSLLEDLRRLLFGHWDALVAA